MAARELNDLLIEKGDSTAIERKVDGLDEGKYGYEKDPIALREFNELLIEKGNQKAIKRKIHALLYEKYGYKKDLVALREFNELLIEKGNQKAIERKIDALAREYTSSKEGYYGYSGGSIDARMFIESLIEKGVAMAIKKKIDALTKGGEIDVPSNNYFQPYQSGGSIYGGYSPIRLPSYGYEKDPVAAQEFIESLLVSEIPHVRGIGKYIKAFALKYGVADLGYEKAPEKAIEFIKHNHVPY